MPFINFRKNFCFFSFDFHHNFDVRTFPDNYLLQYPVSHAQASSFLLASLWLHCPFLASYRLAKLPLPEVSCSRQARSCSNCPFWPEFHLNPKLFPRLLQTTLYIDMQYTRYERHEQKIKKNNLSTPAEVIVPHMYNIVNRVGCMTSHLL